MAKTVVIKPGETNIFSQKAGTTLKLGEHDGTVKDINFTNASDRQRDLEIKITIEKKDGETKTTTDTIVRIKNFFSSDYTKNISSFKDIIINNRSYTINGFIEGYEFSTADKKGVIKGSEFTDTIYGTDGDDKIYTNGGDDKVYLSKGNDSIYGSKDAEEYIVNSEIGTTRIYNSTKGDVLNFKNADSVNFEKVDNDLDINGVIIKDWFKKNNGQFDKMLSDVLYKGEENPSITIDKNTRILQDYRPENKGQKITGINNMNSEIQGSEYNDKITSNTLSDTIYGNGGNDVIYANAKGDNTTRVSYGSIDDAGDFGNDIIYSNMKSDGTNTGALKVNMGLTGSGWDSAHGIKFERKGNDVIAIVDRESGKKGTITFKDYLKTASTVYLTNKADGFESYTEQLGYILKRETKDPYGRKTDILTVDAREAKKGQTIKGTWLGEKLYGSDYNDKIYTGGAYYFDNNDDLSADHVYAGKGNDSIYVGNGQSYIHFKNGDGHDTIYMTKDTGTVGIDLVDSSSPHNPVFTKKGNDLLINRDKSKSDKDADILTIKDYFKQKEEHFKYGSSDMRTFLNSNTDQAKSILEISASNPNKSATLSGTFLNDTITGSNKNDKIYTNGGNDNITAGKGNDTIYVDGGDVTLNFSKGDGVDTVYLRKPSDLTKLTLDFGNDKSIRGYERSANGRDLLINYEMSADEFSGKYDRIIIKDFFKLDESVRNKISYKNQGSKKVLLSDENDFIAMFGKTNSSNKISDSAYRDIIFAGNKNDTIISNRGNDEITGNKGNDRIILAGEDDKDLIFQNGDGSDTIITKDLHNATISVDSLTSEHGFKAYKTADGDIVIGDFGGYTADKESYKNQTGLSFDDYSAEDAEYGKTYDISNSKMFFEKFLENNNEIKLSDGNIDFDELGEYITKANNFATDEDTGKKIDFFEGSEKDDYIIAGKKYDMIDAGKGDDIIVVEKGEHDIDGGEGNDTLVVKNIGSLNWVNGVERLQYNGNLKDLYFVFNVNADGSPVAEEYQGMGIGNSSIINQYKTFNIKNGTWFEDGSLEELIIADKNGLNSQTVDLKGTIAIIKKNVQDYLNERGYSSTMDLAENARSKKDIEDLMKIYKQGISGNDTITATEEHYDILQAGAGNDNYVIAKDLYLNKDITIDDLSGKSDTLELTGVEKDDVHIIADIKLKTDKKGNVMRDKKGNILYTLSDNDLLLSSDFSDEEKGAITIKDYFKNGKIENIKLGDGTIYDVNARLQEMAKWLANSGFTSFNEAVNFEEDFTMKYLNGENVILSNNRAETICTDESEYVSVRNSKDDVFTVDLKNGDDELEIRDRQTGKRAIVNMGTGNKTIFSYVKDITIDGSNADSLISDSYWNESESKGSFNITGSKGDDIVCIGGNCNATVETGLGNDEIWIDVVENDENIMNSNLYGGEGDDNYFVYSLKANITITDSEGDDNLILRDMAKDNIHFAFNVKADGSFDESHDKLFVLNDEMYAKWCNGEEFDYGLTINDFDSIEKIATGDYDESQTRNISYKEIANLKQLKESVVGWLSTNGYADVNDVFQNEKTEGDINALIAEFNKVDWQTV